MQSSDMAGILGLLIGGAGGYYGGQRREARQKQNMQDYFNMLSEAQADPTVDTTVDTTVDPAATNTSISLYPGMEFMFPGLSMSNILPDAMDFFSADNDFVIGQNTKADGGRVGLANGGNPYAGLGYSPVNNIFRMDGINTGTVAPGASSGFQSFEDGLTELDIPETSLLPNPMQTPMPIIPMGGGRGDGDPRRNPTPMSAEDAGYSYSGDPSLGGSATFNNPEYGVLGDTFTPAPGIGLADDQYGRTRNIGIPEDLGLNLYDAAYPVANAVSEYASNPLNILGALAGIPGLGVLSRFGSEEETPDYGPELSIADMPDIANSVTPTQPTGETYSVGYGLGQVDPRLAAAAGIEDSEIGYNIGQIDPRLAAGLTMNRIKANELKQSNLLEQATIRRQEQIQAEMEAAAVQREQAAAEAAEKRKAAQGATFSSGTVQGPLGQGQSPHSSMAAATPAQRQAVADAQMRSLGYTGAVSTSVGPLTNRAGTSFVGYGKKDGRDFGGPSGHGSGKQGGKHGGAGGQGGKNKGTSRF